jgi:predicted nucleic acid-binding protein
VNILIDASAIMAVLIQEPESENIINLTEDTELLAPEMIKYEIGNALSKLLKRKILKEAEVIETYKKYETIPLHLLGVNMEKALRIASKYQIYAYDAYYLETAYRLKIPLLTLDRNMQRIGADLKLEILEV